MRASFRTRAIGAITIALTLLLSAGAEARVVRFVVEQRARSPAGWRRGRPAPTSGWTGPRTWRWIPTTR